MNMDALMEVLKDERVLLAVTAAVTAAVVGVSLEMVSGKRRKLPPGPPVWPIVGSLPSLRNDIDVFSDFAEKYGDIYFLQLGLFGQIPTIVLNSMDLIREALLQKQDDFAGRLSTPVFDIMGSHGHDITFGDFTPEWRYQRKIAHTALRKYATGHHFQDLLEHNVEYIIEVFRNAGDKPQDIYNTASLLFSNILASVCFGKRYELDDPEFNSFRQWMDDMNALFEGFPLENLLPVLKHLPTPGMKAIRKLALELHSFVDKQVAEHKMNFDENHLRDLTDYVIHSEKEMKTTGLEAYQVKLNDIHHRQTILDMIFAGTDTSRNTLTFVLMFLASYPEVQSKAQKEIDDNIGREGKITSQTRMKIPFCEAIIYEILRVRHPGPLSIPHCTTKDTSVGGYEIPKGTQVFFNLGYVHNNPKEWKNPEEFNPERFIDEHGNLAPKPNAFLPFSAGRRSCVGESLAKSQLHIVLGSLLQRFTFCLPDGEPIDLKPKPNMLFVAPKKAGLVVKER